MSLPSDNELDRLLGAAVAIAREAGLITLGSLRKALRVEHKGPTDLLTECDKASETLIRTRLAQLFPDHHVLAEEQGESGPAHAAASWLVDPLDGTTNFAHGHPFYSVSMALLYDGELTLAVVHAPALGVTWSAGRGHGARRNGQPIQVSRTAILSEALCASGFPYDRWSNPDNNLAEWGAMQLRAQAVRRCGSAALDLAMTADGTFDAYWEKRLRPWDMAAGALLVKEAGGSVSGADGSQVPPWPETIVASNGLLHREVLELLASVRRL